MNDEQRELDDALTMFMTDGWKTFIEEIQGSVDDVSLDHANTIEELFYLKGRLSALRGILAYEKQVTFDESSEQQYELDELTIN
jgi:hypothetical protein